MSASPAITKPNLSRMPGHWLLSKMGKRVLRPGGLDTTTRLLNFLAIGPKDDVVEFAPGLGATAELVIKRSPRTYIGVEREPDAVTVVRTFLRATGDQCIEGLAQDTGLTDGSADVVLGEAYLTMQTEDNKALIVGEAFRILRPGGRYGLHELSLVPDGLDPDKQDEIRGDLSRCIHVGARPLTVSSWRTLLEDAGFEVKHEYRIGMLLLSPRRLIADEGWARALRIVLNIARTPAARRRILAMRSTFNEHGENLGAVALVGVKPANGPSTS